ncbi:hypothetical protein OSB04_005049 [Centaurea solstitialis]|uniref:MRG domain-containing protein n=1 Tax=Centaurea solstitialis TaxID=347529 RepID=A0AA38TF93_9ASTR|nr:hypothetical protein OSB04_005049 [Centaurea solstitialis]
MRSSIAGCTDDDDESSATVSDESAAATVAEIDAGSEEDDAVESPPHHRFFRVGEKVLAYHNRRIYEAKVPLTRLTTTLMNENLLFAIIQIDQYCHALVLAVDSKRKNFYIHYQDVPTICSDCSSYTFDINDFSMSRSIEHLCGTQITSAFVCRVGRKKEGVRRSLDQEIIIILLNAFINYRCLRVGPFWFDRWDEWLGMDRLMKYNKENLEKQKALEIEHPLAKMTKSGRASLLNPKNSNVTRGKKRKFMSKGAASYESLIDVQIPPTLKKHLVNYCEYITHMGKLVKLPCSPNVDDILRLYLEHRSKQDGRISDSAGEVLSGLRCYFDKALPAMLLYKGERQQYEEATANKISPSKIYGAEHLLRLFVKLPEILYHANIEEETLAELQPKLQDFLKFLQKKESLFFLSTYETPNGSCMIE